MPPTLLLYTADLVQNDPFLRNDVWYMFSYGRAADHSFIASRFPGARLMHRSSRGGAWVLDRAQR